MNDIKRVILKLSGEALSGDKKSGYDDELIMDIAGQVKQIIDKGINVGVVIGGGNYWRGVLMIILTELRLTDRYACNNYELYICFRDIPFTGT